ncbi:MAG: hypothetical protein JRG76_15485, partial [Deltaproteobacteria bacterium]|nr:hypothetical protein [Deltaproteobacteria bacterium]
MRHATGELLRGAEALGLDQLRLKRAQLLVAPLQLARAPDDLALELLDERAISRLAGAQRVRLVPKLVQAAPQLELLVLEFRDQPARAA